MPELIGERIVRQMNANGDERIDHDEFVKFFLVMLMGTLEQKMHIALGVMMSTMMKVLAPKKSKLSSKIYQ